GNSGVILSQLLRGLAERAPVTGTDLAAALGHATDLAYAAVGEPVEGTMLTVARAAATAAATATGTSNPATLDAVAGAAARAARAALDDTPDQLAVLAEAGVVDAGAAGLVVVLEALARVCGDRTVAGHRPEVPARRPGSHRPPAARGGPAYEVMYLLDAPEDAVGPLRDRLAALGDSLVVVGGVEDGWSVHVHVDDVGSALLAGVDAGRPHRIRVNHLAATPQRTPPTRNVVALVPSDELAALVERAGARAVRRRERASLAAAVRPGPGVEAVVVPDCAETAALALAVTRRWRDAGARVAVVPCRSVVQALAALAVHDPDAHWEDELTAMTAAAAATRHAELPARGADEGAAVRATRGLLDGAEGALVTLVHGPGTPAGLVDAVVAALADTAPGVETAVYAGAPSDLALVVGVE
ncbi:MAG: DAK2 domain-containing protein, partial [Streptosporangiales bacterium]|nr:DAK2 domain-containing protein [Streptosporangiales bacterium]